MRDMAFILAWSTVSGAIFEMKSSPPASMAVTRLVGVSVAVTKMIGVHAQAS